MRQEILWNLFELSNQFLQDTKVDYWVNFGTLLGFHRENGIIGHDIDIDFGCHEKDYDLILSEAEKLHPELSMHDTTHRHHGPKLYIAYKGFGADIYFYKEEQDQLYSHEKTHWENYNAPVAKELVFPVQEYEIRGIPTKIPVKTELYLKSIYGNLEKDAVRNQKTGYWE